MNSKESEFVSLAEKLSNPLPQKDPIIKGNKIRSLQTKVVNINEEHIDEKSENDQDIESENDQDTESKIETILEDDIIVGITYTCRCGEESEIRFEFEREKTEDTVVDDHDEDDSVEEDTVVGDHDEDDSVEEDTVVDDHDEDDSVEENTVVDDHDKDNREDVNTTEDSFIDK